MTTHPRTISQDSLLSHSLTNWKLNKKYSRGIIKDKNKTVNRWYVKFVFSTFTEYKVIVKDLCKTVFIFCFTETNLEIIQTSSPLESKEQRILPHYIPKICKYLISEFVINLSQSCSYTIEFCEIKMPNTV